MSLNSNPLEHPFSKFFHPLSSLSAQNVQQRYDARRSSTVSALISMEPFLHNAFQWDSLPFLPAIERHLTCRVCYSELRLCFDAIHISGRLLKCVIFPSLSITLVSSVQPPSVSAPRKRIKDTHSFKLGTPLPDNGTCKHYKKSFRWLRFPCCGRVSPSQSWNVFFPGVPVWRVSWRAIWPSLRMGQSYDLRVLQSGATILTKTLLLRLINDCNIQQPLGSRSTQLDSVTMMQGGLGCRDPVRMSRKDDKKYKMLRKPVTQTPKKKWKFNFWRNNDHMMKSSSDSHWYCFIFTTCPNGNNMMKCFWCVHPLLICWQSQLGLWSLTQIHHTTGLLVSNWGSSLFA